ncbi:hypothetical protein [Streptomyces sp. NPDC002530]
MMTTTSKATPTPVRKLNQISERATTCSTLAAPIAVRVANGKAATRSSRRAHPSEE